MECKGISVVALALCVLFGSAWADQKLASGSSSGPLTADGFFVEVESPFDIANVFLVLDPTISASNATFSTEVMLTYAGANVWEVPYVVNQVSGIRNWTLSSCNTNFPIMAGTWGLELVPINYVGGSTYEIGYLFGVGNETLDAHGQEATMYTDQAIYKYSFEDSYTGVADLQVELWGDQFSSDYLTAIYVGETECPTSETAVASYTNFDNWDGQPVSVIISGATHGNWFVVIDAGLLEMTTTGPWPTYSITMNYNVETVQSSGVDGGVSSGDGEDDGGDDGGEEDDGDGDGDGIQTWEVVLIIGVAMIAMVVCGGLALFAYMKYKAWQFDRQWDEPVYDSY